MASPTTPAFLVPIEELRARLDTAEHPISGDPPRREIAQLRKQLDAETHRVMSQLSPWERCLIARHPERPYALDYIGALFTDWVEFHGDRRFADDPAIVAGFARFDGDPVAVIGHQKGRDTRDRVYRNFGQPKPEGYRKALRVMKLAARQGRPIITLIDTPGAYPGLDAEERGQAEAIATNLKAMAVLPTPIVVVVTGEGGSGGALAIGVGDRVLMLEFAVYSVISPEGCAAILWKDQAAAAQAAAALRLTAPDLLRLGVIDEIVPEPPGGAHTNPAAAMHTVGLRVKKVLAELGGVRADRLTDRRYARFRSIGRTLMR